MNSLLPEPFLSCLSYLNVSYAMQRVKVVALRVMTPCKDVLVQAMKAYRGSRGMTPCFINLGTR